jgi:hypothetical protein
LKSFDWHLGFQKMGKIDKLQSYEMRPRNYMSKQFIYFAGVLFLMTAAILAVTAQENNSALNNTTMNNTTLNVSINQTQNQTLNASAVESINDTSNETLIIVPGVDLNVTANETLNQTVLNETTAAQEEPVLVQNETIPVQNFTMPAQNETIPTIPVETAPAQNVTIPVQNETIPAPNVIVPDQNITMQENATLNVEPVIIAGATATVSQPSVMRVGSPANPVFVLGVGPKTGEATRIGGYSQTQTYELGSPAKPVSDLGNIAFNFDVI